MKTLIPTRIGAFYYDGKNSTPFEFDGCINPLIYRYHRRKNCPTRLKSPKIRKDFGKNTSRKNLEFIDISYDAALDLLAEKIDFYHKNFGAQSIYAECYEWGGIGKIGWAHRLSFRLMRALGGAVYELGDYSTGSAIASMPFILGSSAVYERPSDWDEIIKHAEFVLFWGTNVLVTNQIAHEIPLHDHAEKIQQLAKKAQIHFIDVYENESIKKLNSTNTLIYPNTDIALALAICHFLYTQKLYAKEFVQKYVKNFTPFIDYVLGKNDGVAKDTLWASEICGISAEIIQKIALSLVRKKSMIIVGRSLQRQFLGESNYHAIVILAAMCGWMKTPGCGIEFNLSSSCKGTSTKAYKRLKSIDELLPPLSKNELYIPSSRLNELLLNEPEFFDYQGQKLAAPRVKMMLNAGGSYLTHQPNANESQKALSKLEFICNIEPFFNSLSAMSDLILPCAIEGERYDIELSSNKEFIFFSKDNFNEFKLLSDFEIFRQLARRLGVEKEFCGGFDAKSLVKMSYLDIANEYQKDGIFLPDFDNALQKGYVKIEGAKPLPPYNRFCEKDLMIDCSPQIFAPYLGTFPQYSPCLEFAKMPYRLVSPHSAKRLHSQYDNCKDEPFEDALISPQIAESKGIKNNDCVEIFNERGRILCRAKITENIAQNCVVVHQGSWHEPMETGAQTLCFGSNVNVLTPSFASSRFSNSNAAHTCSVDIKKFQDLGEYLKNLENFSQKDLFAFTRIKNALNIQTKAKIIGVIGTNGKGSTGRYLAQMLANSSDLVVHFSSPHIFDFCERISLNSTQNLSEISAIKRAKIEQIHYKLQEKLRQIDAKNDPFCHSSMLGYFEYLALLCLEISKNYDYLIFEAGVGAEFDVINQLKKELCIFTPISLDHCDLLGNTLEKILKSKIKGATKNNIFAGNFGFFYDKTCREIIEKNMHLRGAKYQFLSCDLAKNCLDENEFLRHNFSLAQLGYFELKQHFYIGKNIRLNLLARGQKIAPNIIIDVGHNEAAAAEFVKVISQNFTQKITLICNFYENKDVAKILKILLPICKKVQIFHYKSERKLAAVGEICRELKIPCEDFCELKNDEFYAVFGSFKLIENFLNHIKEKDASKII